MNRRFGWLQKLEPPRPLKDSTTGRIWPHLVSQLPEKYRQVITFFYMEDRSYEEVARLLDLPMGSVKTYLHRAKKELAAAISHGKITEGGR